MEKGRDPAQNYIQRLNTNFIFFPKGYPLRQTLLTLDMNRIFSYNIKNYFNFAGPRFILSADDIFNKSVVFILIKLFLSRVNILSSKLYSLSKIGLVFSIDLKLHLDGLQEGSLFIGFFAPLSAIMYYLNRTSIINPPLS